MKARPKKKIKIKNKTEEEEEEERKLVEALLAFLKDYRDGKLEE